MCLEMRGGVQKRMPPYIWIFPGTLEANEGWITWETRHLEGKVLNHFYKDLHQY